MSEIELTILMPCLNESQTLPACINKALTYLKENKIKGEVLISDNGSNDDSAKIAVGHGARVIRSQPAGYGAALIAGIEAAHGQCIIMGDADDSYDFLNLNPFLEKLRNGEDLVIGNRFRGGIASGAMPWLHRYLGNPVLSFLGRLFYKINIGDFHCGLRGFRRQSIVNLNLITTGMEFASEMIVKAALAGLKISEVPTTLKPDGRNRPPHLNTWRDGWRHLRFLLIYSPRWLFLYPAVIAVITGILLNFSGLKNSILTELIFGNTLIVFGFNAAAFYFLTWAYAVNNQFLPRSKHFNITFSLFTLERGIILSILILLSGLITIFCTAQDSHLLIATTLCLLGMEGVFYSFMFSIIGIDRRTKNEG